MNRILIVSSFPPMACGIGAYAAQQAEALRRDGDAVDVLSPEGGDADFHAGLTGGARPARLLKYAWAYDRVFVHFTPHFFYRERGALNRLLTSLAWLAVAIPFGRRLHFVIHETDYPVDDPLGERSFRRHLDRWIWKLSGRALFHSRKELDAFAARFGLDPASARLELVAHGRHFVSRCSMSRAEARRSLGIPDAAALFVTIGFVQPHKGFDRALAAMASVDRPDALLRVVGSVRLDWLPAREHAGELHRLAAADARCEFIETFVTDELFDRWIIAADWVVLPYRKIWSSSVAARAALHGRPVIASGAGGLAEQLPEGSIQFESDEELGAAMRSAAAAVGASSGGAS